MNKTVKKAYNSVRKFAKKNKIQCLTGFHLKKKDLKLDFYFPSKKVGIDIKTHSNNAKKEMKQEELDTQKADYCKKNDIKLINYSGNDYSALKSALK